MIEVGTKVEITLGTSKVQGMVVADKRIFAMQGQIREGQAYVAVQLRPGKDGRRYFVVEDKKLTVLPKE